MLYTTIIATFLHLVMQCLDADAQVAQPVRVMEYSYTNKLHNTHKCRPLAALTFILLHYVVSVDSFVPTCGTQGVICRGNGEFPGHWF